MTDFDWTRGHGHFILVRSTQIPTQSTNSVPFGSKWWCCTPLSGTIQKEKQHAATCFTCFHNKILGVSWYFLGRCHRICHWGKKQLRWVLHYLDLIWNIMTLVLLGSTSHRQFISDSWHLTTSKHRRNDLWLRLVAVDTIFLPVRISGIYRDL